MSAPAQTSRHAPAQSSEYEGRSGS